MLILALDTSTLTGSVALVADGVVLAEVSARMRATHSEEILPVVDEVLRRGGVDLDAVDCIAAGVGPGSFTGVRIGLATAKGLQLATGKPLVGVRSLDALAAAAVGARGLLATVLDARRDEVFFALWEVAENASRRELVAAACASPERAGESVRGAAGSRAMMAIGDGDARVWNRFRAGAGAVELLPAVAGVPLARFVALEAAAQIARGEPTLDDSIEPAYVRASDAKVPSPRVP